MSDYIFPYWDDLDYTSDKNNTFDDSDDDSPKTVED